MAEFCNQCAADMGFPGDFCGLVTADQVKIGLSAIVLCEGCGRTIVDHEGNCISEQCLMKHGQPKGIAE